MQSLVSDLNKYRSIRSAIEALTKETDTLRKDATFLENQKRELDLDNRRILSSSIRLRHMVDFLEGIAFSLRYEITTLAIFSIFIMQLLMFQFDNAKKSQLNQVDEFAALSRSKNGEQVTIKEIKDEVMKAIQILLNKIGPNDDSMLAADLLLAYNALSE